ncbi:hypothetical protein V6N12_010624 [Hibiscus sabdariffa]|uniref:B box-type domain-containing protein n=1 Tax=Hibiscus sabdariffa TaxID=183260 RepID=A0ABR2EM66_9ROSI
MKSCELCKLAAKTYCESDQASLCWDCDAVVHGANFLVARHARCLLCHACQSLTPWRATGSKLGHTVSVCERCVTGGDREESEAENDDEGSRNDEGEGDEEEGADSDDDVSIEDDVEDGDNQVVPWSTVANTPPPPASSSSNSGDYSGGERDVSRSTNLFSLKRSRGNASDIHSQDDPDGLSPKRSSERHDSVEKSLREKGGSKWSQVLSCGHQIFCQSNAMAHGQSQGWWLRPGREINVIGLVPLGGRLSHCS